MIALTQAEIWKEIDSAAYLFLNRLFEPRDNQLTVVLEEAIVNEAKRGPRELPGGILIEDATPIQPSASCRVFTLNWKNYVSYSVTEEMHGSCGKYEDEEHTGRLLRVYSKSHFLDFVAADTGAHSEPYAHYKICCLNHNIDIVSVVVPELACSPRSDAGESTDDPTTSRLPN
jgi:hypothetical protein